MSLNFTKTSNFLKIVLAILCLGCFSSADAQLNFLDDFSTNTSATYTTTGAIGVSEWSVLRSGNDFGARRNITPNEQLELTNDVSATANADGWAFAQTASRHHPVLNQNTTVEWSFNMRASAIAPGANFWTSVFVLAGTNTTNNAAGNGYAVYLGNAGATDPIRLVRYTNGLRAANGATITDLISTNTVGLTSFSNEYLSVKVIYTAATNTWELFVRNDGATAFTPAQTGSLTSQGTAINATHTATALGVMGGYYHDYGSGNATNDVIFDNVQVLASTNAFVTTWIPDGTNTTLAIPVFGGGYNYNVYCQNITSPTTAVNSLLAQTGSASFAGLTSASTYRVFISNTFPQIYFNAGIEAPKLRTIDNWGNIAWTSMKHAFNGCSNLTYNTINVPNLSAVTDMSFMFNGCTLFNGAIGTWNTATVTNMNQMFGYASAFNQPIGTWNTAAVTNMSLMFYQAYAFNQAIGTWNTAAVTDMSTMFFLASAFNQPIGIWNTAAVTDMSKMFFLASAFNQPIGTWNTAAVTDMSAMFYRATLFNQPIGTWNTAAVTDMSLMFYQAYAFNQAIGTWNTAAVTNMSSMFQSASVFNQVIGIWNTAAVTNMSAMFYQASAFNQAIGTWNTAAVTNMSNMLDNCGMSLVNYDNTLIGWAANAGLQSTITLGAIGRNYCLSETARLNLISSKGWTFVGDAKLCPVPEINVVGNAISIVDGDITPSLTDHTDFGTIVVPASMNRVFSIQNTGTDPLDVTSIALSGPSAGDFLISGLPSFPFTVGVGGTQNFTVTFAPTSTCLLKTATITILNYDTDESVYDFAIKAASYCPIPEINVVGNGITIVDGDITPSTADFTDFGTVVLPSSFNRVFSVQNTGIDPLTLTSIVLSGPDAGEFSISGLPLFPIIIAAGGGTQSFTVSFTPSTGSIKNATITINSNDTDEAVYDFAIMGLGLSNYITIVNGNWNLASTWLSGAIPASNGNVIVAHTVDLDTDYNTGAYTLTIQNNKSLNIKNTRNLTVDAGGIITNNGILISNIGGNLVNNGTLTNNGILNNKESFTNNTTFDNQGIVNNTKNANNPIGATLNNSGIFNNNTGGFLTNNGLFDNPWGIYNNNFGATLNGAGTYNGYLANDGTFAPGNSPGVFTINGMFVNNGIIEIEIGGDNGAGDPNGHDRIVVNGDVFLDGEVRVSLINGFLPLNGAVYNFITGTNVFSTFSTTTLPSAGWSVPYTSTTANARYDESLPIELLSFDATRKSINNVQLNWATASELNNQGFDIERMLQNEIEFTKVAWVDGNGTTSNTSYYDLMDNNGYEGVSYYRLKQIDFDGTFSYSNVRAVSGWETSGDAIDIFPNPINDYINIRLTSESKEISLQLLDAKGALIVSKTIAVPMDKLITLEDLNHLADGVYMLSITTDLGEVVSKKIVKKEN